jgi:hypothetical protein
MYRLVFAFGFCVISCTTLLAQPSVDDPQAALAEQLIIPELDRLRMQYNLDSVTLAKLDKIITFDREVFVGRIHNITFSEVRFTYPFKDEIIDINRSKISQILYGDGRRDVFIALEDRTVRQKELVDTTRIIVKNQKDWMKVLVTESPADVAGLKPIGEIKARYEGDKGNVSNDELMKQVIVTLKKKASVMKAHYVLIETKFFHKAYGDLPRVEVTAKVFGYE